MQYLLIQEMNERTILYHRSIKKLSSGMILRSVDVIKNAYSGKPQKRAEIPLKKLETGA